jgi:hypothetical protein
MPALHHAALTLERLRTETADGGTQPELQALAGELGASARLIAQGLAVAQGMARLLAPAAGGYRQDGEPAPLTPTGTLLVRG